MFKQQQRITTAEPWLRDGKQACQAGSSPKKDRTKPRYKPHVSLKSPAVFAAKGEIGGQVLNLTNFGCLIESSVVVKQGDYLKPRFSELGGYDWHLKVHS